MSKSLQVFVVILVVAIIGNICYLCLECFS